MKRTRFVLSGVVAALLLVAVIAWNSALAQSTPEAGGLGPWTISNGPELLSAQGSTIPPTAFPTAGDEVMPPAFAAAGDSPQAFPTPIPGETLVYFVPTDSDATATVLILYNTDTVAHSVALRGYSYSGVLGYSLAVNVDASSVVRLTSDGVVASPPPSWSTPAPIITNFTDFVSVASLSLPPGVKVEGYTLFNGGTGFVDPRADQGAIALRFSTDPNTVFLPDVQNNP
ncbi:MAG: hypothetical protein JNL73_19575 [Anaerolineales bacterium]|nr:hypothetical protein [Anaerolineales bacterium]